MRKQIIENLRWTLEEQMWFSHLHKVSEANRKCLDNFNLVQSIIDGASHRGYYNPDDLKMIQSLTEESRMYATQAIGS